MTSRRVGRPCAKTAKPKTIKIKIKKEPVKKARKAVRMPPPLKPIKIKKEIPRLKKARKPVRMPPPLMSKMAKVKLLNSNNALKKENVKRAKDEKNSKQRESIRKRLLSQQDDIKAVKRVNAQNELRLKLEKEFEKKQKNMLKNQADSKSFFAQRKIDIEKKRKAPTFLEVLENRRKFNTKKMSFADIAKLK